MSTVLSVSQVNTFIKSLLDGDGRLACCYVAGEISNLSANYRSGHIYLTLKDSKAALRAVVFSSSARRLRFEPRDGMNVIARGRISVYEATGQYQLYIEDMQPDGMGSMMLAFEQLKEKLLAAGLFDADRKKPIPRYPRAVGLITSPTGAAVQDMLDITARRWPMAKRILYPVTVQGSTAAESLCRAVAYFTQNPVCDVLIIGRGGGSAEDLWCFNDEKLAYRIAACPIPVISAVGHETDFTICDFVSDLRAPTPSAAAELAVPDRLEELSNLNHLRLRLQAARNSCISDRKIGLDILAARMESCVHKGVLQENRMMLARFTARLCGAVNRKMAENREEMGRFAAKLDALSPIKVLARGYAAVSDDCGPITGAAQLHKGQNIHLRLADGSAKCTVTQVCTRGTDPAEK